MEYVKTSLILVFILCIVVFNEPFALRLYQPNREYGANELEELNWFELCLLKNEIYASYGYNFETLWLKAHYSEQNWYQTVLGGEDIGGIDSRLTPGERSDIAEFVAVSENLGKTLTSCWNVDDYSDQSYDYYRVIKSLEVPSIVLPNNFDSYDFGGGAIQIWSGPKTRPEDLLPKRIFSQVFERSDMSLDNLWENRESFYEELDYAKNVLDDYQVGDAVYRVYNRDDGTVSVVEAMGLGAGDSSWQLKPYVLWRAWFDLNGAIRLYLPVYKGGGWVSTEVIAAFTGPPNDTEIRSLIYGNICSIDMEVREGPYPELPFLINLYDAERDSEERYSHLIE